MAGAGNQRNGGTDVLILIETYRQTNNSGKIIYYDQIKKQTEIRLEQVTAGRRRTKIDTDRETRFGRGR